MDQVVQIKQLIKDIPGSNVYQYNPIRALQKLEKSSAPYDWGTLKDSIEKLGVTEPIIISPIIGVDEDVEMKYYIIDGNHRVRILGLIHGRDYELSCSIMTESEYREKLVKYGRNKNGNWPNNGRNKNGTR